MDVLIVSVVFGIIMMFAGIWIQRKETLGSIAMVGFVLMSIVSILSLQGISILPSVTGVEKMLFFERKEHYFIVLTCLASVLFIWLCVKPLLNVGSYPAEYLSLLFFITCGIILCVSYQNLLMLFLGIEIISIPLFILAGSDKQSLKSNEASLKYFLMGAFSTGVMLMGIALLYGVRGTFDINFFGTTELSRKLSLGADVMYFAGMILIFVSLLFKVSAAPFHFWTPDVYDGAPTPVTAYMATITKGASFIAFIKLFHTAFASAYSKDVYIYLLMFVTIATLVIGNLTAVFQQSVKRMMAYSSIAQAGFMLFALMNSSNETAIEGLYIYTTAYTIASLGVFAVLVRIKDQTFDGFNGLAQKQPLVAFAVAVCLMSLAGIPLTGGFIGKWYMLQSIASSSSIVIPYNGVEATGAVAGSYIANYSWLIIVAVVLAAVSIYYYFRVIQAMYFKQGNAEVIQVSKSLKIGLLVVVACIILLGVLPNLFTSFILF
jgi:NADH-quinone oxidoreductase subunit N